MIGFSEVEPLIIERLSRSLAGTQYSGIHIAAGFPKTAEGHPRRAQQMIIIRDDSGQQINEYSESVRIGVQTWAETKADASDLAHNVRTVLNTLGGHHPIMTFQCVLRPVYIQDAQPMFYATYEGKFKGHTVRKVTP